MHGPTCIFWAKLTTFPLQAAPSADGRASSGGGYFIVRGVEGPEEQLSVELGAGALSLRQSFGKGIRSNKLRLRSHALRNHTPAKGEFIPLAENGPGPPEAVKRP
jgi:hypothetical protein